MVKGPVPRVLQLSVDRPDPDAMGGVALHVAALALRAPSDVAIYTAYPVGGELVVEEWGPRRVLSALPLAALDRALAGALLGTGSGVLHVHSPALGPDAIVRAVRTAGARLSLAIHDHSLVCENYELLEGGSRYCGIPMDLTRCDRCLSTTRGRPAGAIVAWRETMRQLAEAADVVVAPSASVLEHAERVHPSIASRARKIAWGVPAPGAQSSRSAAEPGPLRVAIVGVWAKVKGAEHVPLLLEACRHLNVEWHLFGATEGASLSRVRRAAEHVVLHGAYRRAALAERLVRARCHVVLLPSVGAESFSLTLSEVTAAGFPVVASKLGALGERVGEGGLGWLFDPDLPPELARVLGSLTENRAEVDRVAAHVRSLPRRSEEAMANDHAALWAELSRATSAFDGGAGALSEEALDAKSREGARALFDEGVARAAGRRPTRMAALFDFAKKTDFYRDLRLRRLIPEAARKAVEDALRRPSRFTARTKGRR